MAYPDMIICTNVVALRKESVDRNSSRYWASVSFMSSLSARRAWIEIRAATSSLMAAPSLSARRAWIEIPQLHKPVRAVWSLSARRAWIEIFLLRCTPRPANSVALRKESVDRNLPALRRPCWCCAVALRKESVDRNQGGLKGSTQKAGRSPQGERG